MTKLSVKDRILTALLSGKTFSVAQGRVRFGVSNISARIAELRDDGYSIYTNLRHRGDGTPVKIYRLGTPTNHVRAAKRRAAMTGRNRV